MSETDSNSRTFNARTALKLWQRLTLLVNTNQKQQLENLLLVPDGKRYSKLDELKKGPTHISSTGLVRALQRYQYIRDLGIRKMNIGNIPKAKINQGLFAGRYEISQHDPITLYQSRL